MSKRKKNKIAKTMIGGCISLIGCLSIIAAVSTYNIYESENTVLTENNVHNLKEEHALALTISEPIENEWNWELTDEDNSNIETKKENPAY